MAEGPGREEEAQVLLQDGGRAEGQRQAGRAERQDPRWGAGPGQGGSRGESSTLAELLLS